MSIRRTHIVYITFLCLVLFIFFPVIIQADETNVFTLEDAINYALNNNKGIVLAREKVKEAEAGKIIARAKFFPSLSASASYTRLNEVPAMEFAMPVYGIVTYPVYNPITMVPTGDVVTFPGITGFEPYTYSMGNEDVYTLRASFQYPIFTWWRVSNAYKISQLNIDAAKEDLRKKENELKFSVTQSFLLTQVAKRGLELAKESQAQLVRHLKQAEALYNAGQISKFDFLRAKVQLSSVNAQVLQSENSFLLSKDALKNVLGMGIEDEIAVIGEIKYNTFALSLDEAIEMALKNRPEVKSMDLTVQIAEKSLEISKAGNKPSLALAGNFDYKNPASSGKVEWGTAWSITLALNIPLFQGGENIGKVKQAEAQLNQVKLAQQQLIDGIKMEIKSAFLQMDSSHGLLSSQQENIKEAKEALKIAEDKYAAGMVTNLEYLDAQISLDSAEVNYLKTLTDYLTSKAKLEKAIGQ